MLNRISSLRICGLVFMSAVSVSVQAQECYAPSPNFTRQKEAYYNLESDFRVPLSDRQELAAFGAALGKQLTGVAHRVECLGSEKNPRLQYVDSQVTAQPQVGISEGFKLHAEFMDLKNKIISPIVLQFMGATPVFDYVKLADGHYRFTQKQRHKKVNAGTGTTGSGLEEMIIELTFSGPNLSLSIDHYVNGFYYATDTLNLK